MILASKAREMTENSDIYVTENQLKAIEAEIIKQAEQGKTSVSFPFYATDKVYMEMQKCGYRIKRIEEEDFSNAFTNIYWNEESFK